MGVTMLFRWVLPGGVSIVLLLGAVSAAWSQQVPVLDLKPVCHGIAHGASGAGERGGPDLAFARCMKSEQAMRRKLVRQWSSFASASKQNCVAETTMGGLASYTNLYGCLRSANRAHKKFDKANGNYVIEQQ
jgi:hypothetical protein